MAITLTKEEKQAVLDARIRSDYRWHVRRHGSSVGMSFSLTTEIDSDEVKKAAQQIHDSIVSSFGYDDAMLSATRSVKKFGVSYISRVIKKGLKSGVIKTEAAIEDAAVRLLETDGKVVGRVKKSLDELAQLGTGARFKTLVKKLRKKGIRDPKALAAKIGTKKFGASKMAKLAAAGKKWKKGKR